MSDKKTKDAAMVSILIQTQQLYSSEQEKRLKRNQTNYAPVRKVKEYFENVCALHKDHFKNDFRMHKSTLTFLFKK